MEVSITSHRQEYTMRHRAGMKRGIPKLTLPPTYTRQAHTPIALGTTQRPRIHAENDDRTLSLPPPLARIIVAREGRDDRGQGRQIGNRRVGLVVGLGQRQLGRRIPNGA